MDDRRAQWDLISTESPDLAAFMVELKERFGRPTAIKVELASGAVIQQGVFSGQRVGVDVSTLRGMRYGRR